MALTIEQFRQRVKRYAGAPLELKPIVTSFKKAANRSRSATRREVKKTTLGKKLWARGKKGGPKLALTKTKLFRKGLTILAAFKLRGLGALIEAGGETKAHLIKAKSGGGLSFEGTKAFAGRIIKTEQVQHPGSIVKREPTMKPAVEKAMVPFEQELAGVLRKHARRSF